MTLMDSLLVSLMGFAIVFLVLILLSVLIKLQSLVLRYIMEAMGKSTDMSIVLAEGGTVLAELPEVRDEGWSAGELKLIGVDEKTAAMIMAIVSDESQIPLSELQFKMIKAIDQEI
jgi:Na+-transporting methylmalonyl-CoA/oxaloacetate decarboxylase gamma subunit